jgi:hypothetical protein
LRPHIQTAELPPPDAINPNRGRRTGLHKPRITSASFRRDPR